MEIYLAYALLLALWFFFVTPLIGSVFEIDFMDYMNYLVCGIKVQILIIAFCAAIGIVMWALDVVTKHLQ